MDKVFFTSVVVSWVLLAIAFQSEESFWTWFPIVQGALLLFAVVKNKFHWKIPTAKAISISLFSGLFIYGLFAFGKIFVVTFLPSMFDSLDNLYQLIQPKSSWHTVLVFLLIIPAEEWFWRGYIQSSLKGSPAFRILISVSLYAIAHLASGSFLLVLAAFIAGLIWAVLYEYYKNILVPLISHLVFDLFLFIIFPLL